MERGREGERERGREGESKRARERKREKEREKERERGSTKGKDRDGPRDWPCRQAEQTDQQTSRFGQLTQTHMLHMLRLGASSCRPKVSGLCRGRAATATETFKHKDGHESTTGAHRDHLMLDERNSTDPKNSCPFFSSRCTPEAPTPLILDGG